MYVKYFNKYKDRITDKKVKYTHVRRVKWSVALELGNSWKIPGSGGSLTTVWSRFSENYENLSSNAIISNRRKLNLEILDEKILNKNSISHFYLNVFYICFRNKWLENIY